MHPLIIAPLVRPPATRKMRAASPNNRPSNNFLSVNPTYSLTYAGIDTHYVGSGDMFELSYLVGNWTIGTTAIVNPGNTQTLTDLYWVINGVSVQATYGRVPISSTNPIVMTDGQYGVVIDSVFPPQFGLSRFARGLTVRLNYQSNIPSSGKLVIRRFQDAPTNGFYFNPASASCTNISTTGTLAYTGTKVSTFGPGGILIGKFIDGDPPTWLGIGDSLIDGAGNSGTGPYGGNQYFARGLFGPTASDAIGGINCGESSGQTPAWVGNGGATFAAPLFDLVKYVNRVWENYGTNNFGTAGAANVAAGSMNFYYTQQTGLYTHLKATGLTGPGLTPLRIIRGMLGVRTTSPTDDSTTAGQTIFGPQWDVGGNVDDWNTKMALYASSGLVDGLWDVGPYVRADYPGGTISTNYHRWAIGTNGSQDGTHYGIGIVPTIAAGFRSSVLMAA